MQCFHIQLLVRTVLRRSYYDCRTVLRQFQKDETQIQGNDDWKGAVLVLASWDFGLQFLHLMLKWEKLLKGEDLVSVSQAFQRVFGSRGRPSLDTTPSSCARGENEDQGLALLERGACTHTHTHTHILWPRTDDQQDLAYTLHTEVACDKNNHKSALRTGRSFVPQNLLWADSICFMSNIKQPWQLYTESACIIIHYHHEQHTVREFCDFQFGANKKII